MDSDEWSRGGGGGGGLAAECRMDGVMLAGTCSILFHLQDIVLYEDAPHEKIAIIGCFDTFNFS